MFDRARWFAVARAALKGEERDYTQGDLAEAVVLLAIPMMLELSLESVFAIVDMFFVSRLGANAIATVGLTESAVTIVYSLGIGLSAGATAVVARRIGEKNPAAAARSGAQAIWLGAIASLVISVVGAIWAEEILTAMGASREVAEIGAPFTRILLGGNLSIMLIYLVNGVFRGAGDAAMAMRSLWIASGANIVLCPILIYFFGLPGAAVATVLGRACGVAYQLAKLFGGKGAIRIDRVSSRWDASIARSLVQVSWPATIQFLIGGGSWIFLTRLVAETGGTAASAGYQIALRCFMFFMLPAWGLSNAAATLVGQNLGARQIDRAERSALQTARFSAAAMAVVTVVIVVFARSIVSAFTDDPDVFRYGVEALRVISPGYVFYAISMTMSQALNGAGDTKTPTYINIFCFWIVQTPLAWALAKHAGFGPLGAVAAVPVAHALMAAIAWIAFRRGRWKKIAL